MSALDKYSALAKRGVPSAFVESLMRCSAAAGLTFEPRFADPSSRSPSFHKSRRYACISAEIGRFLRGAALRAQPSLPADGDSGLREDEDELEDDDDEEAIGA